MADDHDDIGAGDLFRTADDEQNDAAQPASAVYQSFEHVRNTADGVERCVLEMQRSTATHSLWGNDLWNAARYLIEKMDGGEIAVQGKSVLELGGGLGAPSLVAAANGARLVVVTDYPEPAVMDLLQRNIDHNRERVAQEGRRKLAPALQENPTEEEREKHARIVARCTPEVVVQGLLWGKDEHISKTLEPTGGSGYDVVILSDLVFNHICHDALLRTVARTMTKSEKAIAYVVFSHHRPHRQQEDLEFFAKAADYGLKVEQTDVRHDFPLMFPTDPGPEEIRKPVWCYTLQHLFDEAGAPSEDVSVDVVVVGTGLVESMISAACARARLKVLHLEGQARYGGPFTTGTIADFEAAAKRMSVCFAAVTPHLDALVARTNAGAVDLQGAIDRARGELNSRDLAIDVNPLVHLADGPLVRALAGCQMGKHLEFQNLTRIAIVTAEGAGVKVAPIPLSRAAAFKSSLLGPMEMRRLMAFVKDLTAHLPVPNAEVPDVDLTTAQQESLDRARIIDAVCSGSTATTLEGLLTHKYKLSAMVVRMLTMDGALCNAADTATRAGVVLLHEFLSSVGRYGGATPFLVSQYGAAEIPQLLCRMTAVWDGMFILARSVSVVEPVAPLAAAAATETSNDNNNNNRARSRPAPAIAPQKGVFSRSPYGSAVILTNGQRITTKCLIVPQECALSHPASPQAAAESIDEASGSTLHIAPSIARAVIVRRGAGLSWAQLDPAPVPEDDAAEQEIRRAFAIPLVVAGFRFTHPTTGNTVTATVTQLGYSSIHAPEHVCVVHVTASTADVSPAVLLDVALITFGRPEEHGDAAETPIIYQASFEFDSARAAQAALRPTRDPIVVHHRQVCLRHGSGNTHVLPEGVDLSDAVTVVPVATLFAEGLDDGRYLHEAQSAFEIVRSRCGLAATVPFLVSEEGSDGAAEDA
jgi:RAB protein geranylgeranyltransferase component A/predicted nicotinamide N-methyase